MTYFADLTPCTYGDRRNSTSVGWLDRHHDFAKGPTSDAFREKLFGYCMFPDRSTMGIHPCIFCRRSFRDGAIAMEHGGFAVRLGTAEVDVPGLAGRVYAAPDLVYHYVVAHEYLPPREFIDAVVSSVPPARPVRILISCVIDFDAARFEDGELAGEIWRLFGSRHAAVRIDELRRRGARKPPALFARKALELVDRHVVIWSPLAESWPELCAQLRASDLDVHLDSKRLVVVTRGGGGLPSLPGIEVWPADDVDADRLLGAGLARGS